MTNQQLLEYLKKPRTAREISEHFKVKNSTVRTRLLRLRKNELVKEYDKKVQCPISHVRAFAYVKNEEL